MSRDTDFLARWSCEKAMYLAWGELISIKVEEKLAPILAPVSPSYFLRTAVVPRVKDDLKLVEKAFYRNKNYPDPFAGITDKVGTRFVVLLGSDIRIVEGALTSIEGWTFSRDRDYEEEQKRNPLQFDYAAVHYVVRPKADVEHARSTIAAGTPCEVQIKTLLQHAYSELTHDTIYKPQIEATHIMERNAAKAMALLEATNDYFEKVAVDVNEALAAVRQMTSELAGVYREVTGLDAKPTALEGMLLSAYESSAGDDYITQVRKFLAEHSFIPDRIKQRVAERNPVFSQPSVLLAYLAASRSARKAAVVWPLTAPELEPLLNDLGESLH